ncbi:MAG: glycosyltransferase family 2 protein [Acidocella sp.]|nr:glycosyltransferase family 2 protein [Acidocella sp.]
MKLVVGIATAGRREILGSSLAHLATQTLKAERVMICPATPEDVDAASLAQSGCTAEIVFGSRGLTCQRNALITAAGGADLLVFFDDDFFPAADYLQNLRELFSMNPDIVMLTGHVIADGITGPGLSISDAEILLSKVTDDARGIMPVYNAYGCNMAIRLAPVRAHNIRFDEALPLYSWLEDVDFSRQLAPHGRIMKSERLRGVHLGTKRGRTSGIRFGYSQIANPLHMVGRKTLSFRRAFNQMARNIAMNIVKSPRPEPWIDRRGRLKGNALACWDFLRGRLSPGRILDM